MATDTRVEQLRPLVEPALTPRRTASHRTVARGENGIWSVSVSDSHSHGVRGSSPSADGVAVLGSWAITSRCCGVTCRTYAERGASDPRAAITTIVSLRRPRPRPVLAR